MSIWEYQQRIDQIHNVMKRKEEEFEELSYFYNEVKYGKNEFKRQVLKKKQILSKVFERRSRNGCAVSYEAKMEPELNESFQQNVLKEYQKIMDQVIEEKRQLSYAISSLEEEEQYYFRRIDEWEREQRESADGG